MRTLPYYLQFSEAHTGFPESTAPLPSETVARTKLAHRGNPQSLQWTRTFSHGSRSQRKSSGLQTLQPDGRSRRSRAWPRNSIPGSTVLHTAQKSQGNRGRTQLKIVMDVPSANPDRLPSANRQGLLDDGRIAAPPSTGGETSLSLSLLMLSP